MCRNNSNLQNVNKMRAFRIETSLEGFWEKDGCTP